MDFKKLTGRAKALVDKRGGTESLKDDLNELKDIAKGEGTVKDKAKAAADALKDPGKKGEDAPGGPAPTSAPPAGTTPTPDPPGTSPQGDTPAGAA
ncbi:MAG TPA: hypothetical protein VFZ89_17910 [Solirubrobacteraceae bacterium]